MVAEIGERCVCRRLWGCTRSNLAVMDIYLAIVQTAAVVAAVGGLIVALFIAAEDRRSAETTAKEDRDNAYESAKEDRSLARLEAERRHRLDLLIRLSANLERGGSGDSIERAKLGAEERALITALGPQILPELFAEQGSYEDGRRNLGTKPATEWNWAERADAVRIALRDVAETRPGVNAEDSADTRRSLQPSSEPDSQDL